MEYLKSEEFYDLFQKGFRIFLQHRSKMKAKFILNLISESTSKDRDIRFNTDLKEIFLTLIDQMSDDEQIFLSNFSKGKFQGKSRMDILQEKNVSQNIAMNGLFAKRILEDDDTWQNHFGISALGQEFMEYIKILANQD